MNERVWYPFEDFWVLFELFAGLFLATEALDEEFEGLVDGYEHGERS